MHHKINLCVIGAAGRLGLCVLNALLHSEFLGKFNLVGAIVSKQSAHQNQPVASLSNLQTKLRFTNDLSQLLASSSDIIDIIIDCSLPESSLQTVNLIQQAKLVSKKLVLCATGFSFEQQETIRQAANFLSIVFVPNASIGMNLTHALAKYAAKKIPELTDIQILETHHVHKKDAPSGAAKQLANSIEQITGQFPTIRSTRVGETIGEHTLLFNLNGEQIQLTHKALDRSIFALGALRAATWVNQVTQPGFYTMEDVLFLNAK